MRGKELLSKLLGSTAAPAAAVAVAGGAPGLSAEQQSAGTSELESLVENAFNEGKNAGLAEGRKAERERLGAVLTSEEAVGRTGLAITLLSTTDNTPEQIASALKASPSAAEMVSSVQAPAPAGVAPIGQRAAADPLAPRDPIAEQTPVVDLGAPQPPADGPDEKAIVDLWAGALSSIDGSGIVKGSVWDGLIPAARAN